jgi:hypothetical protein
LIQKKKGSRPSRPGAGSTRCFASEPKAYFPAPADVGQQEHIQSLRIALVSVLDLEFHAFAVGPKTRATDPGALPVPA